MHCLAIGCMLRFIRCGHSESTFCYPYPKTSTYFRKIPLGHVRGCKPDSLLPIWLNDQKTVFLKNSDINHLKGTSGGPRHCIWTPDCLLKLSCYLALDPPEGIHITDSLEKCIGLREFQAHDFRN